MAEADVQQKIDAAAQAVVEKYGTAPSYDAMLRAIEDRDIIPCRIILSYNDEPLQPGEFGFMMNLKDGDPSEGFLLYLHPALRDGGDDVVALIAYQLVVAFGPNEVIHSDAERFGATIMGMDEQAYYEKVCELADAIPSA